MKTLRLLPVAALIFTGCVSQTALNQAVDEKIAANNVAFVQPMMAQQNLKIEAMEERVKQNARTISKSTGQVSTHRDLLIDHYRNQQERASTALQKLVPKAIPKTMPVQTNLAPADAVEIPVTEQ